MLQALLEHQLHGCLGRDAALNANPRRVCPVEIHDFDNPGSDSGQFALIGIPGQFALYQASSRSEIPSIYRTWVSFHGNPDRVRFDWTHFHPDTFREQMLIEWSSTGKFAPTHPGELQHRREETRFLIAEVARYASAPTCSTPMLLITQLVQAAGLDCVASSSCSCRTWPTHRGGPPKHGELGRRPLVAGTR